MAKLGRYSGNRMKVVSLETTATEIQPSACGTLFVLDGTAYSGDITHSLPHPSEAGAGWWCKFVVKTQVLDAGGDDCLIKVRAAGASTFVDDTIVIMVTEGQGADQKISDHNADFVTIKGEALAGANLEVICDGSLYYIKGQTYDISADMAADT